MAIDAQMREALLLLADAMSRVCDEMTAPSTRRAVYKSVLNLRNLAAQEEDKTPEPEGETWLVDGLRHRRTADGSVQYYDAHDKEWGECEAPERHSRPVFHQSGEPREGMDDAARHFRDGWTKALLIAIDIVEDVLPKTGHRPIIVNRLNKVMPSPPSPPGEEDIDKGWVTLEASLDEMTERMNKADAGRRHFVEVCSDILTMDLNKTRDSTKGSVAEQVRFEVQRLLTMNAALAESNAKLSSAPRVVPSPSASTGEPDVKP